MSTSNPYENISQARAKVLSDLEAVRNKCRLYIHEIEAMEKAIAPLDASFTSVSTNQQYFPPPCHTYKQCFICIQECHGTLPWDQ